MPRFFFFLINLALRSPPDDQFYSFSHARGVRRLFHRDRKLSDCASRLFLEASSIIKDLHCGTFERNINDDETTVSTFIVCSCQRRIDRAVVVGKSIEKEDFVENENERGENERGTILIENC